MPRRAGTSPGRYVSSLIAPSPGAPSPKQSRHMRGRLRLERGSLPLPVLGGPVRAEVLVQDLVVQLEDCVEQHLWTGRTPGQVHVHRNDVVDTLHDRVVVEHAAAGRAYTHRQHPLRSGHLVVDLAQHGRHLLAHPTGHYHEIGLPWRGAERLHAEPSQVVAAGPGGHHLDRAAGQAERGRPQRVLAGDPDEFLDRGQQNAAGKFLLDTHLSQSHSRPPRRHTYMYATSTVTMNSTISTSAK